MGATTYHFGSKEALYRNLHATLSSCNAERLRLLRKAGAEAKGKPLTVEKIVDCMVRPPFLRGSAHPKFHALLARNLLMPPLFLHAGIQGKFEPTLPSCSRHSVVPLPV
jgi:AcrR family transcriptional regulator